VSESEDLAARLDGKPGTKRRRPAGLSRSAIVPSCATPPACRGKAEPDELCVLAGSALTAPSGISRARAAGGTSGIAGVAHASTSSWVRSGHSMRPGATKSSAFKTRLSRTGCTISRWSDALARPRRMR